MLAFGLLAIPVLILINAFFVAAEFALVALRRTRVEELVSQGRPRAASLLKAIDELNDSVAAAQLGITIASLALGLVSEPAIHRMIHPALEHLPEGTPGWMSHALAVALTLLVVTFLHVVFGEQMPKIAALQSSERIGLYIAPPLTVIARIARPVIRLMNGTSNVFLRRLGYDPEVEEGEIYSVDELRLLIEDTQEAGLIDSEQADVVRNVFALPNIKVRDCMVPWDKVMSLDVATSEQDLLAKVRQGAHTRMPVYDGTPDNLIGVVNTKDLFYLFSLKGVVTLIDAMYEPVEIGADSSVSDALKKFKTGHKHLAVVKEADGKVVGILTLEDVLEEIVGDIEDEHDKPVPKLRRTTLQRILNRRRMAKR
jgi:CBS domain containing-hemolysin-like protein